MPKLKIPRGLTKRVKVTSTGKIMRGQAGRIHFRQKQSGGRKRSLAGEATITGSIARGIKRALGV